MAMIFFLCSIRVAGSGLMLMGVLLLSYLPRSKLLRKKKRKKKKPSSILLGSSDIIKLKNFTNNEPLASCTLKFTK